MKTTIPVFALTALIACSSCSTPKPIGSAKTISADGTIRVNVELAQPCPSAQLSLRLSGYDTFSEHATINGPRWQPLPQVYGEFYPVDGSGKRHSMTLPSKALENECFKHYSFAVERLDFNNKCGLARHFLKGMNHNLGLSKQHPLKRSIVGYGTFKVE